MGVQPICLIDDYSKSLERATRIELAFSAWEADVLPLNYARVASIVQRLLKRYL